MIFQHILGQERREIMPKSKKRAKHSFSEGKNTFAFYDLIYACAPNNEAQAMPLSISHKSISESQLAATSTKSHD